MKVIIILLFCADVLAVPYEEVLINVAGGKPAIMKDVYKKGLDPTHEHVTGNASSAVDGNSNPDYNAGSCSHTESKSDTWWMVDFLGDFQVAAVIITNRNVISARLQNFQVYVSRENPNKSNEFPQTIPGQLCFDRKKAVPPGKSEVIPCIKPITGRYLTVFKPANDALTICELKAMATRIKTMNYYKLERKEVAVASFSTFSHVTRGEECVRLCFESTAGFATAVQYRENDGRCQCFQIHGFEKPQFRASNTGEWILYFAQNN